MSVMEHRRTRRPGAIDSRSLPGSPYSIAECRVALAANLIAGLSDGDPVAQWSDISGSGNNLVQATETNKPTYETNIINSLPVVRFDGNDNYLSLALAAAGFYPLSLAMVLCPRDEAASDGILSWGIALTDSSPFMIVQRQSTNVRVYVNGGYQFTVAHATNAVHLYLLTWDGATWSLYTDGGAASTYAGGVMYTDSTTLRLGVGYNGYAYVDIAEVLLYERLLSSDEQSILTTVLKTKYAIA